MGAVSSQWLLNKGGPELGFTWGRFDPQRLNDQEVYAALLHEGTEREQVVGFVTWLPYEQGRSAVLDLMRRAQECPLGVMEMLIVESLADFARRGRVSASLGGVPLANVADGPSGVAQHLLAWTYANGGTLYDARDSSDSRTSSIRVGSRCGSVIRATVTYRASPWRRLVPFSRLMPCGTWC